MTIEGHEGGFSPGIQGMTCFMAKATRSLRVCAFDFSFGKPQTNNSINAYDF